MSVRNAKTFPKRFFGLHMTPGVAEYREPEKDPYRIMVGEEAIKNMDPTFEGKPVYVRHVDEVDLANIHEADGVVVRSFYNKTDGKHWVEFMVISDKGHEAIRNGWRLSNAYIPKQMANGGLWHGVEYQKEVMTGEYEHLAIVPNPRYEESVILTPDQFKAYNSEKELELKRVANSKGEKSMSVLNFFKKSKVENSADFESTSVVLPLSKKEMTIADLVSQMDTIQNMQGYANGDHMVKVGEEEMSVKQLVNKYSGMKNKMDEAEAGAKPGEEKKENEEDEDKKDKKENEEDEDKKDKKEKKENEEDEDKKDKKEAKKENAFFEAIKNAPKEALFKGAPVDLSDSRVARGKSRYGSGS